MTDTPLRSQSALQLLETHAKALEEQLEIERLRLAGCGVAAMADTPETAAQRLTRDSPYWSASYGDVCRMVDQLMRLRAALETIRQGWETFPWGIIAREALRGAHELYPGEGDNRAVSTEGCRSAATVSGTPESYSCSDPRQDARTPAGDGAPSPVLHAHET